MSNRSLMVFKELDEQRKENEFILSNSWNNHGYFNNNEIHLNKFSQS